MFKTPTRLSTELCEDIGVHIGDGNIYDGKHNYVISCFGDAVNEKSYYREFLIPLRKKLYGIDFKKRTMDTNTLVIYANSKGLVNFFKELGIPSGKKVDIIDIPRIIKDSVDENILSCIRGIIDTDFAVSLKRKDHDVHDYPVIGTHFASKKLVKTLEKYLRTFGFKVYTKYNRFRVDKRGVPEAPHWIFLNGKRNLELWFSTIGSHNPKHITKYLVYKKFGFSPPFTTTNDRMGMLRGIVNPYLFYRNESEFRRRCSCLPILVN